MALIGYARVSTEDQVTHRQLDELQAAGCHTVLQEHASGGDRDRPVLAQALARVQTGDTLVVVSLDRLARSLSHLLEVIEGLQGRGPSSAASRTRWIPPVRRGSSPCRCSAPPPSSSAP